MTATLRKYSFTIFISKLFFIRRNRKEATCEQPGAKKPVCGLIDKQKKLKVQLLNLKKMKHVKKIVLLFFLPALLSLAGCNNDADGPLNLESMTEQEIQALFVGKWQEIERIDPLNPDRIISARRDTTIVFSLDGTFQGNIIDMYTYYSLDKEYLRVGYISGTSEHRFLYSFTGKNKLTLDLDSGNIPYILPSPTIFSYKKIK
jgi:hypothetical protein